MKTPQFLVVVGSDAQQRVPTALEPVGTTCRSSGCPPEGFMSQPYYNHASLCFPDKKMAAKERKEPSAASPMR